MENLALFLPFLIPIVIANLSEQYRQSRPSEPSNPVLDVLLRFGPHGLLLAINVGLAGLAALSLLNELATSFAPDLLDPATMSVDWWLVGLVSLATAVLASAVLFAPVRRWLARWLPIAPESLMDMTALSFAAYQLGASLGQMALIGSLETLTESGLALTVWDVLLSGVPLVLFAVAGVGWLIRRGGRATLERLGLVLPTRKQWLLAVGVTVLLLAFDFGINAAWQAVDPSGYDLLERVTENLFGNLLTVGGALTLGLSAGISEEMLFRGAVQPRLGLVVTAFLFAISHLQYGITIATLEIFIIGLVLGLVRNRANTTVCIVIHASYNAVGVLLGMLQP